MHVRHLVLIVCLPVVASAQGAHTPPDVLPAAAAARLRTSLEAASAHRAHAWRDTPPLNEDGTINGYVEIARGDRRKWEFNMRANARAIDRVIPEQVGGYPVNYGFVPQTVSYDGDPFDVLVLGPAITGPVRGAIVGVMYMEDEKGLDSKVVLSPVNDGGRAVYTLSEADRRLIGDYFRHYKDHEPGAFSRVPGWGAADEGLAWVETTHTFFQRCRQSGDACRINSGR